jgi:hypothetical protein
LAKHVPPQSSDARQAIALNQQHKRTRSLLATDLAHDGPKRDVIPPSSPLVLTENGDVHGAEIDLIDPMSTIGSPAPDASWTLLTTDKSYTPTQEDIGCVMKVEVSALSISDNQILAGPIVAFTEPVLSAPKGPPKRHLVTLPAPSAGSTGARFRVISYNILAELYATKQVRKQKAMKFQHKSVVVAYKLQLLLILMFRYILN